MKILKTKKLSLKNFLCFCFSLINIFLLSTSQAAVIVTYYHTDAQGSVIAATDDKGAVLWKESYRPFGGRIQRADNGENSLWYTGHAEDKTTKLTYMGARWYDPVVGRFLSTDPANVDPANSFSFNRFSYANNNPYVFIDPDGRDALYNVSADMPLSETGMCSAHEVDITPYVQLSVLAAGAILTDGLLVSIYGADAASVLTMMTTGEVAIGGRFGGVTKGLAKVPGRVQSRINLSNKGIDHVLNTHLNPARAANKSQFALSQSELRSLLSSKNTVQAPARALETGNFARTITTNRTVGNLADKMGGGSTNTFTVITDKYGNLQSAFPGGL